MHARRPLPKQQAKFPFQGENAVPTLRTCYLLFLCHHLACTHCLPQQFRTQDCYLLIQFFFDLIQCRLRMRLPLRPHPFSSSCSNPPAIYRLFAPLFTVK